MKLFQADANPVMLPQKWGQRMSMTITEGTAVQIGMKTAISCVFGIGAFAYWLHSQDASQFEALRKDVQEVRASTTQISTDLKKTDLSLADIELRLTKRLDEIDKHLATYAERIDNTVRNIDAMQMRMNELAAKKVSLDAFTNSLKANGIDKPNIVVIPFNKDEAKDIGKYLNPDQ